MSHSSRSSCDVAIVGGGITGLAAAHRVEELARERALDVRVRLFDERPRIGGQILTESVEGLMLEAGPDQFVAQKAAGLALCRRLGLEDQLQPVESGPSTTQVIRNGRPVRLPDGFTIIGPTHWGPLLRSPLLSLAGKLRVACEPLIPARRASDGDESLRSMITRRFGRELFEQVAEPILAGLFTADGDRMSVEMTVPRLKQLEERHGSITRALRLRSRRSGGAVAAERQGFVTLRGGIGRLVDTLATRISAGVLRTGSAVERIGLDRETRRWRLTVADQDPWLAHVVILACPAPSSARLVRELDPDLAGELAGQEQADCATVYLLYPSAALGRTPDSFGFFVGRKEGIPILACSHVSVKFPDRSPAGHVLLRVFLGGARDRDVLEQDDEALGELAHRSVARLLQIDGAPVFRRTYRASMPQFPVGWAMRLEAIRRRAAEHPGLVLGGGVTGAIGVPDCIASGEQAALDAIELSVGIPAPGAVASAR